MRPEDFNPAMRQHLVPTIRGQVAFVPPPLPDDVELSGAAVLSLERAALALGELNGAGQWMDNPYLLINPFLRREAVLSSKIEGTQASLSDLVVFEAAPAAADQSAPEDVREVANYVRAVELGLAAPPVPPTLNLIRALHEALMDGVRGQELTTGEFRTEQNWIGRPRSPIEEASYVPPPPIQMHGALTSLEEYLRRPTNVSPLVRIALVHYQFEAIHPFRDGNGRVGRLLITLLLMRERLVREPLLYLSAYFERNRGAYYDHLAAVSREGDRDSWIRYFLEGIHEQARDAVERARRLFSLQRAYHQRLQTPRGSALPLRLVDALFANPAITVPQAQQLLGVTYRAAAQHVARLVDGGMLRQAGNREWNRVYVAGEVLQLLEEELPAPVAAAEPLPIQGVLELD